MAQLLALEWDDAEARVAVADVHHGSVVLEQAFAVSVPGTPPTGTAAGAGPVSASGAHDLGAIGRRIGEALAARGIRRGKTLVAVGRTYIELKNLTLPPAPPEELPELVRFQAEREFNALGDDWPLDFLPIPGEPGEPLTVLAAAISPELVAEIQATCESASLVPQRFILRPCAAASLLSRTRPANNQRKLRMLIDLLAEEADLTVLSGDAVVFLRTARLPGEAMQSDPLPALLPELRRTIAAVHNRYHGRQIEEVFLCGEASAQGALARDIGRDLNLPTEVFNPLTCCRLGGEVRRRMPDHPSRFAPLVGMLLDEAAEAVETIDFLNPRRKAVAPTRRREWIVAGAAAAVLVLGGAIWIWARLAGLDSDIAELTEKSRQMDARVKQADAQVKQAGEIDKWLSGVVWLDKLAVLASKAPPAQDLMLTHLNTPYDVSSQVSKLHLEGLARNTAVVDQMHQLLRDQQFQVTPNSTQWNDSNKRYGLVFKADIQIRPAAQTKPGDKTAPKPPITNSPAEKPADAKAPAEKSPAEKAPASSSETPQPAPAADAPAVSAAPVAPSAPAPPPTEASAKWNRANDY